MHVFITFSCRNYDVYLYFAHALLMKFLSSFLKRIYAPKDFYLLWRMVKKRKIWETTHFLQHQHNVLKWASTLYRVEKNMENKKENIKMTSSKREKETAYDKHWKALLTFFHVFCVHAITSIFSIWNSTLWCLPKGKEMRKILFNE